MVEAARPDAERARDAGRSHRVDVRAGRLPAARAGRHSAHHCGDGETIAILTMLAWTIYISFIGVLALMLLPKGNAALARKVALLFALLGLGVGIAAFTQFKAGDI